MKNFEEQKKDYLKRLIKYSEMVIELTKEKKNEKIVETLLNPQNEKELEFGNYYIMYIEDSLQLSANASCNNVIEINPKDSIYIEYLSSIINAVYKDLSIDEINKTIEKYKENNGKLLAKVMYELIVLTITNPKGIAEILNKKCNFNFDDEIEVMKLSILIKKANETLQPEMISITEEEINEFISFVKHYHNFCIQGIKNHNNSEVQELLSEMYAEKEITEGFTRTRNIK